MIITIEEGYMVILMGFGGFPYDSETAIAKLAKRIF